MRGFVLKDHDASTTGRAYYVNRIHPQVQSFGAVVLTRTICEVVAEHDVAPATGHLSLHEIRADPSAWSAAAADEGLRWLAPFGMTEKLTTADVTLRGVRFPAGTEVAMVLGSANRDEARYADPDVFDLDRPRQSHAAFGYGLHFCLGHFVARQLQRVMLEEMFPRLPNLRLDPGREATVHGWAVRAAKRLPVIWDA